MSIWNDIVQQVAHSQSTELIAKVFGGWIYSVMNLSLPGAIQGTVLTVYTTQLHQWVWFIFIILFIYLALSSAMNAAKEGDWAKKEWAGMWAVVRIVFGMVAIVPFSTAGILGASWFVIWLGLASSGMADLLWKSVLTELSNTTITAQTSRMTQLVEENATNQIMNHVFEYVQCSANRLAQSHNSEEALKTFNPLKPDRTFFSRTIAGQCSGKSYQTFIQATKNLSAPSAPKDTDAASIAAFQKAQVDYIFRTTTFDYIQKVWQMYTTNIEGFQKNTIPSELKARWEGLRTSYRETIINKIQSAFASDKRMGQAYAEQVAYYGWVSAGNYYRDLAAEEEIISWALNAALLNSPNFVDPKKAPALTNSDAIADLNSITAQTWLDDTNSGAPSKTKEHNTDPLGTYLLKPTDHADPILAMSRFGKTLENVAVGLIVGRAAVSAFSFIPGVSAIDKLVNNAATQMATITVAIAGIVLGTVLPLLPSIFFALCVISWFIYLLQMFIVAPFWLVANAAPEGDGFSSVSARKGFNNALFVVGFPIFSIGGLVASIMVCRVGLGIINNLFYQAFAGMAGFMSLPLAFIGLCCLYCITAWSVITNSMGLIQSVPRTLLDWLSLAEPGLHPFSHAGIEIQTDSIAKTTQGITGAVGAFNAMTSPDTKILPTSVQQRLDKRYKKPDGPNVE